MLSNTCASTMQMSNPQTPSTPEAAARNRRNSSSFTKSSELSANSFFKLCTSPSNMWRSSRSSNKHVTANFPLKMLSRTASIERQLQPYEVLIYLVSKFPCDNVTEELSLYVQEVDGWYNELLIHFDDASSVPYHSIDCIHDGDHLIITSKKDNLKPRSRLSSLAFQFKTKPALKSKLLSLGPTHAGWRPLLSDGNSFYRATYVGLFEHLLMTNQRESFKEVGDKFKCLGINTEAHTKLCALLQDVANGQKWVDLSEFEMDVSSCVRSALLADREADDDGVDDLPANEITIDAACVAACRELLAQYVLDNEKHDYFGVSLSEALLSHKPDAETLKMYCEKYVSTMGVEADGPLVDSGILQRLLRCRGNIVYLDRRDGINAATVPIGCKKESDFGDEDAGAPLCSVDLFHRPGHFDIIYSKTAFEVDPTSDALRHTVTSTADITQVISQPQVEKENVLGHCEIPSALSNPPKVPKLALGSSPRKLDMHTMTDDDKASLVALVASPRVEMRKSMSRGMDICDGKSRDSTPRMCSLFRNAHMGTPSSPSPIPSPRAHTQAQAQAHTPAQKRSNDCIYGMQKMPSVQSSLSGQICKSISASVDDDAMSMVSDKTKSEGEYATEYVIIDEDAESELSAAFMRQFTRQSSANVSDGGENEIECRGGGRTISGDVRIEQVPSDDDLVMVDIPQPVSDNELHLF